MNIIFGLLFLAASFTILTSVLNNFDNKVYGQVGSFLTVSGSEYKDVRDSETLHLQKFSLGGWFKTGNNFSENGFIVNKGGAGLESKGTNLNYGIWMSRDETINAGFETEDGQNYVVSSVKKYADNQWHYVFVTYDGKKLKLYMDGRIVSEAVAEAKPDSTGSQPVRIGANSFNASKFFVGEIDEIRLWDRVLTDNEVNEGYLFNKFNIRDQILYASFSSEKVPVPMNIPVQNYQDNIISDFLAKQNKDLTSAIQDFDIYQKSPIQDFAAGDCKQYSDKLPVSKIKSSGALSSYPNKNVNDGNLDTRWSVLGLGSYIQLDLGTQKKICHAYIAWFRGDERQMTFTISISSDGKSFKKVFSGTTSGKTESFEHYSFANTKGRYVKITVTDSTMNDWVSISEIKVNGLPLSFTPPPSPPQEETGLLKVSTNVINDNGGTYKPEDFTVLVTGNNPNPASFSGSLDFVTATLSQGSYQVDSKTDGYDTSYSDECSGTIFPNQIKICNITHNDLDSQTPPPQEETGQLKVITNVINNDDGTYKPEDFIVSVTGNNPNPASFSGSSDGVIVTMGLGSYQVESETDGYDTSYSEECSGTISANDIKTCTITNNDDSQTPPPPEREFGQLEVITNVINDNGGTYKPEDFTVLVTGNNPNPASFSGNSDGIIVTLDEGSYQVESEMDGYDTSYSEECSGTISANDIKTCTITNNDDSQTPPPPEETGQLKVITNVINNDDGTYNPEDFIVQVTGNNPNPASFSGSLDGVIVTMGLGSYQVESETDGYDTSYSEECSGTISANDIKTCTITNNDDSQTPPPPEREFGQLEVITNVINDNGGTYKPEDFTVLVTGNNPNPESFSGNSDGIIVTLDEGSYQVESEMDGYDTSYSEECSGTISANDIKTCTITNNDDSQTPPPPEREFGQLEVITNVINNDGGVNSPEDFTVLVTGNNPNPESFSGNSDGIIVTLDEGSYQVESEMDGYDTSYSEECSGTISANDIKACTITNDDQDDDSQTPPPPPEETGQLKVITSVVNNDGGTYKPEDFIVRVTGNNPNPASFSGNSDGIIVTLDEGSYQVESEMDGYDTSYSEECSGTISANDIKTCTITNNDDSQTPPPSEREFGQLEVITNVINDNGGTYKPEDFRVQVTGNNPNPESFTGYSDGIIVTLDEGAYQVESEMDGYDTSYSPECSGTISANDVKTCTITNNDLGSQTPPPPSPNPGSTVDEFGTTIPFKLTGKYVDLERGSDHRNGQRFSVNHFFENYIGIGYLLTGNGQELVENKHDGPNHSGRTDVKNTAHTWTEPAFRISDGQARIGSEHPHPDNGPEIIPDGATKIGNIDKKWIGYGSYSYKSTEGYRVIGLLGTPTPFDAEGKPNNSWKLGFHLIDKGQVCDSGSPNSGCETRAMPPQGQEDGFEYEIRMHKATSGDTDFKWFRIYEIENPNTDEPPKL